MLINLALVTKEQPLSFRNQFMSLLNESDEFDGLLVPDSDSNSPNDFFSLYFVYRDEDLEGLKNSINYIQITKQLHIDRRSIPKYLQAWEIKKLKNILETYSGIALEDLHTSYR